MNPLFKVNLINDDSRFALELVLFTFNIQKKICDVLEFKKKKFKYEKRKVHNMFSLMLNLRFKNLCSIFFLLVMKKNSYC
jgi:hypothetical protein